MFSFDLCPIQGERTQCTGSIINKTKPSPLTGHESMFISNDCLLQCANNRRPHQGWSHAAHARPDNWHPVVCCSRDPTQEPPCFPNRSAAPPFFNLQYSTSKSNTKTAILKRNELDTQVGCAEQPLIYRHLARGLPFWGDLRPGEKATLHRLHRCTACTAQSSLSLRPANPLPPRTWNRWP
jgi:hypothetical protein